ncbi:DprA-like DNA processing chain A [Rhodococcus phage NiceHouse]|nr:DprA-like DNA processing chain A [Rhodococcus phage NiceHouse]
MYKLLVTGSRDWTDTRVVWNALDTLYYRNPDDFYLLHGAARGVDTMASLWAGDRVHEAGLNISVKDFRVLPEHWEKYGKRAGMLRNIAMVDKQPDIVLAFIKNQSKGATQCAEYAEQKGITVVRFEQSYPEL